MFRKSIAGITAGICLIAAMPVVQASADDSYAMSVSIDLSGEKKSISPYIYGVNEFSNSNLKGITVNNVRQGGNRMTGYNWETNYSSAGEDWMNSSDNHYGKPSDGPAYPARQFSENCQKFGVPYKMTTLQMCGYVAADMNGTVTEEETAPSARWNKVAFTKDGELSLEPDLTDDTVYIDEYVNYLVKTLGDASTETGFQAYSLDNEPMLWNDTHPRIHPEECTNSELVSKSIELAKRVKAIDPKAEVYGPAFWGMLPCINAGESGNGFTDSDWQAVKGNYRWYLEYYLDQMKKAEEEAGTRLLDVIDVHYYSQGINSDDDILQAARSLYDPTYIENSWLQPWSGQYFPFIPNIQDAIDKYYPGTKIAVSEYNLGNISNEKVTGKSVYTAIAEAEALGAFAENNVYFATYWGTLPECPFVASAINLYTNYDGKGSAFGDTLVSTKSEDLSKSAAFASINGSDDSQVTLVLSNKEKEKSEKAEITIDGSASDYKSAVVYAITKDDSGIRVIDVQNDLSGNKVTVELPPLSVAQIVLSDKASDAEVYEAPDITTKEVTFQFSELEKSKNGYPMIPIEDAKALKKAVINSTATCSSTTDWFGGGGGLCFNKLITADSNSQWGQKSFMYSGGTGDTTVLFDGTFNIPDPTDDTKSIEVEAEIGDTYIEFQDWWKSSNADPTGADVTVTYNTITMYYEWDGASQPATEPTSEPTEVVTGKRGDVTGDNEVTVSDIVCVLQFVANKEKYPFKSEELMKNADVNGDGDITADDAFIIQQIEAGVAE
jgi:hypothetical protein